MKDYAAANKARGAVKIFYNSQKHYETITGDFKMLREWKVCAPLATLSVLAAAAARTCSCCLMNVEVANSSYSM